MSQTRRLLHNKSIWSEDQQKVVWRQSDHTDIFTMLSLFISDPFWRRFRILCTHLFWHKPPPHYYNAYSHCLVSWLRKFASCREFSLYVFILFFHFGNQNEPPFGIVIIFAVYVWSSYLDSEYRCGSNPSIWKQTLQQFLHLFENVPGWNV